MATANSLSVAYNRCNPVDHAAAGFVTGFLYRLPSGYKPAVAAAIVGSALGFVVGSGFWIAHMARGTYHNVRPPFSSLWNWTEAKR